MADNAKKPFEGTVKSFEHKKGEAGDWRKYEMTFEGESKARKVDIPPDSDYEPQSGDELKLWPGKFNSWTVDKSALPERGAASSSGSGKSADSGSSGSGKGNTSQYRDPKTIELQEYFNTIIGFYQTALPGMDENNIPKDWDEVDGLIDQAFAKAQAFVSNSGK